MTHEKNTLERVVAWIESVIATIVGLLSFLNKGPLGWIFRKVGQFTRWYRRRVWDRYARNGDGQLTKKRTAGTLISTMLVIWMIPTVIYACWQGLLMATTWENEELYLTSAEEVGDDIHSVRGCRKIPCSESDAIYFRVRSSLMHNLYAIADHGSVFYPDYTASVVAPGVNSCKVVSYGFRVKALMRGWDIYPDMLDATCVPYETGSKFSDDSLTKTE